MSVFITVAICDYYTLGLTPNNSSLKHYNKTIRKHPQTVIRFSNETSLRNIRGAFLAKNTAKQKHLETFGDEKPSKLSTNPRFAHSKSPHIHFDPKLFYCTDWNQPYCKNKTEQFKEKILYEFRKASFDISDAPNIYHVSYKARRTFMSSYCLISQSNVKTLQKDMPPLKTNLLGTLLPRKKLLYQYITATQKPKCIIVSSAGSIKGSGMGDFIGEWKFT